MLGSESLLSPRHASAALLAAIAVCSMAAAHHSFAMFDGTKLLAIHGTVTKWVWANPHSWLYMDVARADGSVENWSFECSSPNMMIRWGWNADDIQVGDKVVVDAHPARNGQHIASAQTLFLATGKVLSDPMGQQTRVTGDQLATGLGALQPSQPRGEEYK
jgi:hypothetical protein